MPRPISRRNLLLAGLTASGSAAAAATLSRSSAAGAAESLLAVPAAASMRAAVATRISAASLPWAQARAIVAETKLPSFPAAVFKVANYGAKNDGATDNTAAFKKAIAACHTAGGGTVVVPAGTYVTGAIRLKSNVHLRLDGAVLMFTGDKSKYPIVVTRYEGIECMNYSPMIYAHAEKNIALTGSGILDASRTAWNTGAVRGFLEKWVADGRTVAQRVVPGSGNQLRVAMIEPYGCDRVLIQGIRTRAPMFWQLHPTLCTNVTVDGVITDTSRAHVNTDACDPESCDHVVIKNCYLGANDDLIAIKSGRDADGRRINVPSQNIVVFGNTMDGTWGAITCGSELTGGIQNVYAYKNHLVGSTKHALYVKSNSQRGGFAKNINLDSFTGTMGSAFAFLTMSYKGQSGKYPPSFGPFVITNSSCTKTPQVFNIQGLKTDHVHGFDVRNCSFNGVAQPSDIFNNVDGLRFTNVKINGKVVTR